MKKGFKAFNIKKRNEDNDISVSDLDDIKQCHIMVFRYGELQSISLNKTEVRRLMKALDNWIKFNEVCL